MPFRVECAQSFSSSDATEADLHRAFDDDRIRGEYIILTAPNGDYIQAAGEGDGPYSLEYRINATSEHQCAVVKCSKDEVRNAFLAYMRGDESWRTGRHWKLRPAAGKGCLTMLMLPLLIAAGIVAKSI